MKLANLSKLRITQLHVEVTADPTACPKCGHAHAPFAAEQPVEATAHHPITNARKSWWQRVVMCDVKYRWLLIVIGTTTLVVTYL